MDGKTTTTWSSYDKSLWRYHRHKSWCNWNSLDTLTRCKTFWLLSGCSIRWCMVVYEQWRRNEHFDSLLWERKFKSRMWRGGEEIYGSVEEILYVSRWYHNSGLWYESVLPNLIYGKVWFYIVLFKLSILTGLMSYNNSVVSMQKPFNSILTPIDEHRKLNSNHPI